MKRGLKRLFVYFLSLSLVLPNFSIPVYASEIMENMEIRLPEQEVKNTDEANIVTVSGNGGDEEQLSTDEEFGITVSENDIAKTEIDIFKIQTIEKFNIRKKMLSLFSLSSAVIKADGSLWMWGYNFNGQLGDGTTINKHEPVKIMEDVIAVSLGGLHSAALKTDGSLWMWGANGYGQLGDGTTINKHEPVKIMEDVIAVSLGGLHSAALKTDGSLWMWGANYYGQLGDSTTIAKHEPVKIMEGVTSKMFLNFLCNSKNLDIMVVSNY